MPRTAPRLPADDVRKYTLTLRDWKPGTITLLREGRTPPGGVVEALNATQVQDGVWRPKWGSQYWSVSTPSRRKGSATVTTNLVANSGFETGVANWTALALATITQDATEFYIGTKSMKIAKALGGTGATAATTAVVPATTYHTGSVYAKQVVGGNITVSLVHNGVTIGSTTVAATGAWQRISVTAKSGAGSFGLVLKVVSTTTSATYVDAAMITATPELLDYFNGDTADTADTDYDWTGTVGGSASTKSVYLYEPYNIDGSFPAVNPDESVEVLEVAGGKLYRSTDGGVKTEVTITGGTLTAAHDCYFLQIRDYVYIGNNYDPVVRYDTNTKTAAGYTALSTPTAPSLAKTGLVGTNYRAYYVIVASNLVGTTVGSAEASITVGKVRDEWATSTTTQNTTDLVTVTITRLTGATRYNIFYADQSGKEVYLDSVADPGTGATFDYIDRGQVPVNDFVELPDDNTTGGPKMGQMELSGNRIWGLDGDNHWRINWSGVGQYTGIFSPFYGGGYLDLELGGRERPTQILHYRDGKGTAMATVFTLDPEGNGSTWQIVLETVTVGTTTFIVPNPVKIVGSIGSSSSRGACKVGDDIVFGNLKGAFSLGSQPSIVNVLATRELSSLIRPDWRRLSSSGMRKLATYFYDAKVFFAVPANGSTNSQIWIRDTEQRNWQLGWQGIGIKAFFEVVDETGNSHFIGVPAVGNRLIEFGADIRGDLGVAFETRIKTGLIPINKNHNIFAQIDKAFVELGSPRGNVTVDVYGYDHKKGYTFLKSIAVAGAASTTRFRWGYQWSTKKWSYIAEVPELSGESSYRRYKRLNNLLNSVQFIISCSGIGDYFELFEYALEGFQVDVEPPRSWKNGALTEVVESGSLVDESGRPILI